MTQPAAQHDTVRPRSDAMLRIRDYGGGFGKGEDYKAILHDISFDVPRGQLTAVVGETGSGKSMTAMSVLRIQPPSFRITSGQILFDGLDLLGCSQQELRSIRGSRISMVFQDARAALNPVLRVGDQIADVCERHQKLSRKEAMNRTIDALKMVQIPDAPRRALQYPHEFSGGMAQRVMIAMALVCRPELLILDEPTTGLDVTIQAEIMGLITGLGASSGLTTLLITHDLGVVAETADSVVVMHDGRVVEVGTTEDIFLRPREPYTRRLIAASQLKGRHVG